MKESKSKLKKLKKRFEEIEPILNKTFKTSSELKKHIETNKSIYTEGKELSNEIEKLEFDMMTPQEKVEQDKLMHFLELKAKGKPFDPEAEELL